MNDDNQSPGPSQPVPTAPPAPSTSTSSQQTFRCPWCTFTTASKKGLSTHTGAKHKSQKKSQALLSSPSGHFHSCSLPTPTLSTQNDVNGTQSLQRLPLAEQLRKFKQMRPLIVIPPKRVRSVLAAKLAEILERVSLTNSHTDWSSLLLFGFKTLHLDPSRGDKCRQITENVTAFDQHIIMGSGKPPRSSRRYTDEDLAHAADRRLRVFADVTTAVRILSSEEKLVDPQAPGVLDDMLLKHPPARSLDDLSALPPPDDPPPLPCTTGEVLCQLKSFRKGVSGGLDGLTPVHLLCLIESSPSIRKRLLKSLAAVCSIITTGKVPNETRDALFGAWLIGQSKRDGGLRPIAIGSIFRRLATKIMLRRVYSRMGDHLKPLQLGYGVNAGGESCVHATRSFLQKTPICTLLKVDFKNAFNSHFRQPMLLQIKEQVPELYRLALSGYGRPTPLFFGNHRIESSSGCQQGDPAAPLFFSLVLQPLMLQLKSQLTVAYLDDLTLADGDSNVVAADLALLREAESTLGLSINVNKCEIFRQGHPLTTMSPPDFHGLSESRVDELELLGTGLFPQAIPTLLRRLCTRLSTMNQRLHLISAQSAFFLLRHSLGVQRAIYLLRASPTFAYPDELSNVDSLLLRCAELCLNISVSSSTSTQVCLPIKLGGLGLRSVSNLALPCFLASTFASEAIVHQLTGSNIVAYQREALESWTSTIGETTPQNEDKSRQSAWDKISVASAQSLLHNSVSSNLPELSRLQHAAACHSGAWLHVRPDENLGTVLSDAEFRIACSLRLGLDLFPSQTCSCGAHADPKGYHFLSCHNGASVREARHNAVNDVIVRAVRQAGVPVTVEPTNLCPNDSIRPDGMTLTPWTRGKLLVWDVTIRNTYATSYARLRNSVGGVAAKAEHDKLQHYAELCSQFIVKPFVVETSGVWGNEALLMSKDIGQLMKRNTGDTKLVSYFRQRVALEVQRGNAKMILNALPGGIGLTEINYI